MREVLLDALLSDLVHDFLDVFVLDLCEDLVVANHALQLLVQGQVLHLALLLPLQLLLLVLPLDKLFQDLLEVLDFAVLPILQDHVDDRVFERVHDVNSLQASSRIQWPVMNVVVC